MKLRDVFDIIDQDRSGSLDRREVAYLMQQLVPDVRSTDIHFFSGLLDVDGTDRLSFAQLLEGIRECLHVQAAMQEPERRELAQVLSSVRDFAGNSRNALMQAWRKSDVTGRGCGPPPTPPSPCCAGQGSSITLPTLQHCCRPLGHLLGNCPLLTRPWPVCPHPFCRYLQLQDVVRVFRQLSAMNTKEARFLLVRFPPTCQPQYVQELCNARSHIHQRAVSAPPASPLLILCRPAPLLKRTHNPTIQPTPQFAAADVPAHRRRERHGRHVHRRPLPVARCAETVHCASKPGGQGFECGCGQRRPQHHLSVYERAAHSSWLSHPARCGLHGQVSCASS